MSTDKMREALVMARAGLVRYQENCPQTFSECDNEAVEQIDAALSKSEPALEHKPDTGLLGSLGKNWAEDAGHENGNYTNKCNLCDSMFLGHKRRVICKECAVQLNPPYLLKYRKDPAMWNEDILHKPEVSQPVYAYDVPIEGDAGSTELAYAAWYRRNPLPDNAIPLFTSPPDYEELKADNDNLKLRLGEWERVYVRKNTEIESLKLRVAELEAESRTKHEYAMQMLGERDRLQSECDRLRDAAKQALLALHYHTEQTRPIDTSFGAMNVLNAALMPAQKEQEK